MPTSSSAGGGGWNRGSGGGGGWRGRGGGDTSDSEGLSVVEVSAMLLKSRKTTEPGVTRGEVPSSLDKAGVKPMLVFYLSMLCYASFMLSCSCRR